MTTVLEKRLVAGLYQRLDFKNMLRKHENSIESANMATHRAKNFYDGEHIKKIGL